MNEKQIKLSDEELKKCIDELEGTKFLNAFCILDWIIKMKEENKSLRKRIKTIKRLRKKQTQKKNKYKSIIIDLQNALTEKNNKIDKAIEILKLCNSKCAKETIEILKDSDVDD